MFELALAAATGVTTPFHVLSVFVPSKMFLTAVDGLGAESKICAGHVASSSHL